MNKMLRLGVGAPIPETAAFNQEAARLKGQLTNKSATKKRAREEEHDKDTSDLDDAEESRAFVIKKKLRNDAFGQKGKNTTAKGPSKQAPPASAQAGPVNPLPSVSHEVNDAGGEPVQPTTTSPKKKKRKKKKLGFGIPIGEDDEHPDATSEENLSAPRTNPILSGHASGAWCFAEYPSHRLTDSQMRRQELSWDCLFIVKHCQMRSPQTTLWENLLCLISMAHRWTSR
jgi:hypothetical protein